MTAEALALIAGAVLSLIFSYVPGAKDWFEKKSPEEKRLWMAGILLVVTLAIFGGGCINLWAYWACTWMGALEAAKIFLLAVAANQSMYLLSPGVHSNK